jgi:hypothetical protein
VSEILVKALRHFLLNDPSALAGRKQIRSIEDSASRLNFHQTFTSACQGSGSFQPQQTFMSSRRESVMAIGTTSRRLAQYSTGMALSLMLWTSAGTVQAHIGHDNEFKGSTAEQVMKPIEVEAKTVEAMGIKTEAITASGETLQVPAASVVDATGNQLVYVQSGASFKPVVVKIGATSGDSATVKEGNLKAGDRVVTQGATLLYSQALRGAASTEAPHSHPPSKKLILLGVGGVVLAGGAIAYFSTRLRKFSAQSPGRNS